MSPFCGKNVFSTVLRRHFQNSTPQLKLGNDSSKRKVIRKIFRLRKRNHSIIINSLSKKWKLVNHLFKLNGKLIYFQAFQVSLVPNPSKNFRILENHFYPIKKGRPNTILADERRSQILAHSLQGRKFYLSFKKTVLVELCLYLITNTTNFFISNSNDCDY